MSDSVLRKLRKLSERDLRNQVLIPLFSRMGYSDVADFHGGALEQGKDIIMWRDDKLRGRINIAVVVKVGRISGKASGKGSAAEVASQVRQAIASGFKDPRSLEHQTVHECIVVTSGDFTKEARESLSNLVDGLYNRLTTLHNGKSVADMLAKYLPEATILADLSDIGARLNEMSPDFDVVAKTGGKGVELNFAPRAGVTTPDSLTRGLASFEFPNTPEGQAAKESLEKHLRTGETATIPFEFVRDLKLPPFLSTLVGSLDAKAREIELRSVPASHGFIAAFEIRSEGGESRWLHGVPMRVFQAGLEQITLTSIDVLTPYRATVTIDIVSQRTDLTLSADYNRITALELHHLLAFHAMAVKGGLLTVAHEGSELPLMLGQLSAQPEAELENPMWPAFVERAAFIQQKTGLGIQLPLGGITDGQFAVVLETAHILETGTTTFRAGPITISVSGKERMQTVLSQHESKEVFPIWVRKPFSVKLFGRDLDLGQAELVAPAMRLAPESASLLRELLEGQNEEPEAQVTFVPSSEQPISATFQTWASSP